jgi:enoyl-CoA hydratase/carnithine racemase
MAEYECFRLEKREYVGHLILSRPEKRNRMSLKFFEELIRIFETIDEDEDVRAVLISAEGKSFTAGLDLAEAATLFTDPTAKSRHDFKRAIMRLQESMNVIDRCRKPVVGAIHSHCIGGGVDMACVCDIRLASEDAVFSIRETRMAMVADLGTLQRIGAIIGQGWTRELALTGRDFDASQALQMGFVTHVVPDRDALIKVGFEMTREIAQLSPVTVQGVKETLNFSRNFGAAAGLEFVAQKNAAILPSEDLMEAFQAFMEKRKPEFKGR